MYDFGTAVPLAVWWPGKPGGRVLEDYVNLMDLAPTFLELGDVKPPKVMTGRSLVPVLNRNNRGWWMPSATGSSPAANATLLVPAPICSALPSTPCVRRSFYIINFNLIANRWAIRIISRPTNSPTSTRWLTTSLWTFGDLDASLTKAWLMQQVDVPKVEVALRLRLGRRPRIELYDLKNDPDQLKNVAGQSQFVAAQKQLHGRLMSELKRTGDPRVSGDGSTFDKPPIVSDFSRSGHANRPP